LYPALDQSLPSVGLFDHHGAAVGASGGGIWVHHRFCSAVARGMIARRRLSSMHSDVAAAAAYGMLRVRHSQIDVHPFRRDVIEQPVSTQMPPPEAPTAAPMMVE